MILHKIKTDAGDKNRLQVTKKSCNFVAELSKKA